MFYVMGTGSRSMVVAADRHQIYDDLRNHVLQLHMQHPDLVLIRHHALPAPITMKM